MEPVNCYCISARRAARALTNLYDQALEPAGLKVTQFSLLRMIGRLQRPAITALADATGLERSTLGRNLRVLERRGLIELGPGADERERIARLTGDGTAALARAHPLWSEAQARIEGMLTDAEQAQAMALFTRLAAAGPPLQSVTE